jgi:8-oxo-dGTP pyrophosphatase MutT (NUDIX family)
MSTPFSHFPSSRICININMVKERLRQLLARRQKHYIVDAGRLPSAVLLPLYKKQGQCHILFIKRSDKVKEHKSQISFPGGTCEKLDSTPLATALRECAEEIGLQPEDVDVLGSLDDELTTTSNYIVSPFVGAIPWPYRFQKNEDEVDEIIEVPISALLDKNCFHPNTEILSGRIVDSYTYYYQGKIIWGATARILNKFLDIYIQASPDDQLIEADE